MMENDIMAEIGSTDDNAGGNTPAFTNRQAAAWVNEGENGPYLTVQVATGRFNLFPNTDDAEDALEYLAKKQRGNGGRGE